jgi:hypothetical protein
LTGWQKLPTLGPVQWNRKDIDRAPTDEVASLAQAVLESLASAMIRTRSRSY